MKKIFTLFMVSFMFTNHTIAQTSIVTQELSILPQFFIVIIAGVLLALGFQVILTAISIASGITAIGDVRKTYINSKHHINDKDSIFDSDNDDNDNDEDSSNSTGLKVSMAFGVWSLITLSISLFLATLLAMNLVMIASIPIAVTLSLVIWATFIMILFYFESRLANTLIGSLIGLATSGLKASGDAINNIFSSSEEAKVKDVVDSSIEKLRSEFSNAFDFTEMKESLKKAVERTADKVPDYDQLKKDLKEIVSQSGKSGSDTQSILMAVKQAIDVKTDSNNSKSSDRDNSKLSQLRDLYTELKESYESGDGKEEKLRNVASEVSTADEETTQKYIDKFMGFLNSSDGDAMNSKGLSAIFQEVVQNPSQIGSILSDRLDGFDKQTIIDELSKNTSLEKGEIARYADMVDDEMGKVKGKLSGIKDIDFKGKIEDSIKNFFNGAGKRDVNYDVLKHDFQKAINHPSDSFSIIKNRISQLDENIMISLLTANTGLGDDDIDAFKKKVTGWKEEAMSQYKDLEDKATLMINNAKRKAVIEAEHVRKIAISAAWWLVISALVAGGAAVGGGILSL